MHSTTLRAGLLLLALLLLPFNIEIQLAEFGGFSDLQHRVSIFLFDAPLVLLTAVSVPLLLKTRRGPLRTFLLASGALVIMTGIALAVHPSARGFQMLLRLVVNLVVPALTWAALPREWQRVLAAAFVAAAVLQTAIGIGQVVRGETLGLTFLGENPPLLPFGDALGAKGTFVHPYMLAGFALIACGAAIVAYLDLRERAWLMALAVVAVPIGLTYSRMSVLAVVAITIVLVAGWFGSKRWTMPALIALLVGLGIPGLLTFDAWIGKAEPVPAETGLDAVTNFRGTFTDQALDLISDEPLVGVGPGLYVLALEERLEVDTEEEVFPVHNVPLLVAAEGGLPAGVLATALLAGLGLVAVRGGTGTLVLFLAYLPFLLLDHFPYDNFQGLTMTGLWTGMILGETQHA